MTVRLMLIVMLAMLCPVAAMAQDADYVWHNVRVGGGGFIPGVVFSPVEPGLAYARSDMGGAYRFDAARDRWIPPRRPAAEPSGPAPRQSDRRRPCPSAHRPNPAPPG